MKVKSMRASAGLCCVYSSYASTKQSDLDGPFASNPQAPQPSLTPTCSVLFLDYWLHLDSGTFTHGLLGCTPQNPRQMALKDNCCKHFIVNMDCEAGQNDFKSISLSIFSIICFFCCHFCFIFACVFAFSLYSLQPDYCSSPKGFCKPLCHPKWTCLRLTFMSSKVKLFSFSFLHFMQSQKSIEFNGRFLLA